MMQSQQVQQALERGDPVLWLNPAWTPAGRAFEGLAVPTQAIADAEARWQRFAPLLAGLFPDLGGAGGIIESPLLDAPKLARRIMPENRGRLLVKADHALPVAGSIKARGGIYAVLHHAEGLAAAHGILSGATDDCRKLAGPEARALFARHELSVGSTGNLGLSIGIMGAALGFKVTVHMSVEAKAWKKERLRRRGVNVVEHASDYTAACVVARAEAERNDRLHFIDDENSVELFLGYATAVPRLAGQLEALGVTVDADHPLFLYLPCGVGGAPGGITFAARHVFGDHAHCFFVEPVEAPCMLLGMQTGKHAGIAVYDIGLTLKTDADGLAVSTPSRFIGRLMEPLLSGCLTTTDADMYGHLLDMYVCEGLEVEPSAAAGCAGPSMLIESPAGAQYLDRHGLTGSMPRSTHIVWTTGGLFVPAGLHHQWRDTAQAQPQHAP